MRCQRYGFTLIEVLIALAIFAIIAVICAVGLHQTLLTRTVLQQQQQQLMTWQMAFTYLQNDLTQVVDRPVMTNTGQKSAAMMVLIDPNTVLEFTHGGMQYFNDNAQTTDLQRVSYFIEQGQLIRQTWPVLDRSAASVPQRHVVLNPQTKTWLSTWPRYSDDSYHLPRAVKVTLCISSDRCLWRIFALSASSWRAVLHAPPSN